MTKVLVLYMDNEFEVKRMESNEYKSTIGGYFEVVTLDERICCYVNEEGRLLGLPLNPWSKKLMSLRLIPCPLYGNIIVCHIDEEGDDQDLEDDVIDLITRHCK